MIRKVFGRQEFRNAFCKSGFRNASCKSGLRDVFSISVFGNAFYRSVLRRPLFPAALLLICLILAGRFPGCVDPEGKAYSIADRRRMSVSGIVVNRECTANGYRLMLDHLVFLNPGKENGQALLRTVTDSLNHVITAGDRLQVFLSDGQEQNEGMYGIRPDEGTLPGYGSTKEDQSDLFSSVRIGDRIVLHGKCTQPERATNPGQLDMRKYYLSRRIILKMGEVQLLERDRPSFSVWLGFRNYLAHLRIGMQMGLSSVFGPEDAAQAASFLLGEGSGLDSGTRQLFRDGGLSWLVCVSGLHISLTGMMLYRLLRKRRLPFAVSAACAFAWALSYAILTGFGLSAQRVLVTFGMWLGAQVFGRTRDTLSALSAAAVIVLVRQPAAVWDSSFLLSGVCILSMDYLTPVFSRILRPAISWQRSLTKAFALYAGSLPAVLWFFYQTTPYTFLLYPVMPAWMGLTIGFSLAGSICGYAFFETGIPLFAEAGKAFAWPGRMMLKLLKEVCFLERKIPCSVLILGRPAAWQMLLYYAVLILFSYRVSRMGPGHFCKDRRKNLASPLVRTRSAFASMLCAIILMISLRQRPAFRFTCLDIGQGSCNLIEHDRSVILFDAGSSSVENVWRYRIDPVLKYYGIRKVDMVFLSHADLDHINGMEQMLSLYTKNLCGQNAADVTIGKVILPALPVYEDRWNGILELAARQGIMVCGAGAGSRMELDGMELEVLHPSPGRLTGNANEDCIVMLAAFRDLRILLMGDLEKEGEAKFVRDLQASRLFPSLSGQGKLVLIAGHHGSKYATSEALLEMVKPDAVLISCGKNNRYGHPAGEMLRRLEQARIPYHRTDLEGAIRVSN